MVETNLTTQNFSQNQQRVITDEQPSKKIQKFTHLILDWIEELIGKKLLLFFGKLVLYISAAMLLDAPRHRDMVECWLGAHEMKCAENGKVAKLGSHRSMVSASLSLGVMI